MNSLTGLNFVAVFSIDDLTFEQHSALKQFYFSGTKNFSEPRLKRISWTN